ncbi:MAG TPA: protein kinase [Candidatus Udaeobacter sp.]|nr:protein kinase [Candidatus Udaeobacter sp.]
MNDSDSASDPLPSSSTEEAKCEKCAATIRLDTGICVNCLLREGLEGGDEVSKTSYQSVLAEVDAPQKSWFLGNYEILEQIGCGGMGVIYRARQRHSRRIVAVKRVLSYRADSHGALQRFRREAQAVASLDHPNILPIYEVSESEDGLPFFSMKLADKGSLHEHTTSLREQPRKCVELMAKVARAVEYAHSRGVLHRDLKPGNILLDDRGEPLVSDFGLAKLLDGNNDLTRSLTTFGTAGFIAPEQAGDSAADVTPAADVYSLGAVLFNMLTGRPPFLGANPVSVIRKASETQAPKLRSLAPSLDRDVETICARCLEREPGARYRSAGELAAELDRWLDGRPIMARPVSAPARIWRWSQRNPKLVGAATAGILLGATAVWLFRGEPQAGHGEDRSHLAGSLAEVSHPAKTSSTDPRMGERDRSNLFTVPGYLSPTDSEAESNTRVTGVLPMTEFIREERDTAPNSSSPTNKTVANVAPAPPDTPNITGRERLPAALLLANKNPAAMTAALPDTESNTTVRDRSSEAALRPKKIAADTTTSPAKGPSINGRDRSFEAAPGAKKSAREVTVATAETRSNANGRDRSPEAGVPTSKLTDKSPASIQGFVKDAKGEPIKGADLRIESRDGKQVLRTAKTDPNGHYSSQGLQPGVYRVTLAVNGAVKASIMNTRTKVNQPTELNFDFKKTPKAAANTKGRKHMVWVPNRTGSHIGGTWVEVDDKGNEHSESNMQTYAPRR